MWTAQEGSISARGGVRGEYGAMDRSADAINLCAVLLEEARNRERRMYRLRSFVDDLVLGRSASRVCATILASTCATWGCKPPGRDRRRC